MIFLSRGASAFTPFTSVAVPGLAAATVGAAAAAVAPTGTPATRRPAGAGAAVDAKDEWGETPLMAACANRDVTWRSVQERRDEPPNCFQLLLHL